MFFIHRNQLSQIAYNAGYEGSIVIDRLKHAELGTASTLQQVNGHMTEAGIIDPVKVSRSASKCRASASLILTTEAVS